MRLHFIPVMTLFEEKNRGILGEEQNNGFF